jgi:molecular chaperone GrpE
VTEKEKDPMVESLEAHAGEEMLEAPVEADPSEAGEALGPEELVAQLKAELEEAQAKAGENLDGWQRALADFANYKKRVDRDRETVHQEVSGRLVLRYLEILDDLELALKNRPPDGDGATWAEGIALISRKLQSFLESEGVQAMDAEGQMFDPNLHEALTQEDSDDHESGQIIAVVQKGYRVSDRVIRPARVRVAR